jgi:hypothetical protein
MKAVVGRPVLSTMLLVALAFTLLGHICVLPLHGHGHESASSTAEADSDHHAADDSVHAASCEALRSTSPVGSGLVLVARPLVHDFVVSTIEAAPRTRCSPSSKSPPLFLLHASLLI